MPAATTSPSTRSRAKRNGKAEPKAEPRPLELDDLNAFPYRYEIAPVEKMFVDRAYQRDLTGFVKKLVKSWNPHLVQTLALSERSDGRFAVIDGQTRMAAAVELKMAALPALVYEGLRREDEARIFELLQTQRRGIMSWTRFRAALLAKNPEALAIKQLCEMVGYQIGSDAGQLRSVAALEYCFRQDEFTLERSLSAFKSAWGERYAPAGEHIRGLQHFFRNFPLDRDVNHDVDDDRLVRRLSIVTPGELSKRSVSLREGGYGGARMISMAKAIEGIYRKQG